MAKPIRHSIAEVSEKTLRLQEYLNNIKPGEVLSYIKITNEAGINMDEEGKQKLRSALRRAKIEYSTIPKYGIKLADSESTMPILSNKIIKINRAVQRAERTHKNLEEQFFSSLSKDEQQKVLYIGAVFGAIRVAAENGRVIYGKSTKQISSSSINIPIPKI